MKYAKVPMAVRRVGFTMRERGYWATGPGNISGYGRTRSAAVEALEHAIKDTLEALDESPHLIVTNSGEVLVALAAPGGQWGYTIARDGTPAAWVCGFGSRQEAIDEARGLAEQSYGGVGWESDL